MKLCVAQTRPHKGDIPANIDTHLRLIREAAAQHAELIVFPELSLTGYEPSLADSCGIDVSDSRLDVLQQESDRHRLIICAGAPIREEEKIMIGMVIFQPEKKRKLYTKQYLHEDERPFFSPGHHPFRLSPGALTISFAICYEISVPAHRTEAARHADVYIASVAKSVSGTTGALTTLAQLAKAHTLIVMMSNFVGRCDDFECGGETAIWNTRGEVVAQLNDQDEGLLMIDTETGNITRKII